jgi:hypothetical protein
MSEEKKEPKKLIVEVPYDPEQVFAGYGAKVTWDGKPLMLSGIELSVFVDGTVSVILHQDFNKRDAHHNKAPAYKGDK